MGVCLAVAAAATAGAAGCSRPFAASAARGRRVRGARARARRLGLADALRPVAGRAASPARLWALCARRDGTGGVLLGLAIAAKLWPALALPALLVVAARRGSARARCPRSAARAPASRFAFALGLSPGGLWHALSLQAGRPLQVESLGASALVSLDHLGIGGPYAVITSSGSQNLTGGYVDARRRRLDRALAGDGRRGARARGARDAARPRRPRRHLGAARFSLCAVAAGIAFGHVLSPQFVLWLLPVPAARRRTARLAPGRRSAPSRRSSRSRSSRGATGSTPRDSTAPSAALVLARDLVLVAIVLAAAAPAPRSLRASAGRSRSRSPARSQGRTR